MKHHLEVFGESLMRSKLIRQHLEKNEQLLFETIRLDINTDATVKYLEAIDAETQRVLELIEAIKLEKKRFNPDVLY